VLPEQVVLEREGRLKDDGRQKHIEEHLWVEPQQRLQLRQMEQPHQNPSREAHKNRRSTLRQVSDSASPNEHRQINA